MRSIKEAEKIVNDRNLKQRVFTETDNFDFSFAYCVEDDVFCSVDVPYNDYISKHFICFTKYGDGKITAGIASEEHTPLLQKFSDEYTIVIGYASKIIMKQWKESNLFEWAERLAKYNPNVELWKLEKRDKTTGLYMTKEKRTDLQALAFEYTSPVYHVWYKDKCILSTNDRQQAYGVYSKHINGLIL